MGEDASLELTPDEVRRRRTADELAFPDILKTGSMLRFGVQFIEKAPERLGPYRILERIGQGGMGDVYLAEQDPPLVRHVAIKLSRTALSGDRALARFESERQTLALMNHPNIARVYDAGSAPDARPYFVMELVAGEPITEFCDERRLNIEERLQLFVQVCEGVQHAHQNAVIHRDLKPSNILVTTVSGPATPKIIDFGVAKALGGGPAPDGGLTLFGQIVGTLEYMSPEQAALDGRGVDTRTDVYSLGVIFYELLVGGRPFERDSGPESSFVNLCRRIREEDPERPSARTARTADADAARCRDDVPQALARRLRRDLDAIAMKALAKDPAARYATPAEMAADVERFLQHRPIAARTPGPIDRMRKVLRRHRRAALVIGTLSIMLVCAGIAGTLQALQAQRVSARAEGKAQVYQKVTYFLEALLNPPMQFKRGDWPVDLADTPSREGIVGLIHERFAEQPELEAKLLLSVGQHQTAIHGLGPQIDRLRKLRDSIVAARGPNSLEALDANEQLARICAYQRPEEAEAIVLDLLERRRRVQGPDHRQTVVGLALLGDIYKSWEKHDKAVPVLEASAHEYARIEGPEHRDVLLAKLSLSGSYLELGRYADTQALLEPILERVRGAFGERSRTTLITLYNIACARANLGDTDGAFRYLQASIDGGWNYPLGIARDHLLFPLHSDPRFDVLERAGRLNERDLWQRHCIEAEARLREGKVEEAERLLRDLVTAIEHIDRNGPGGQAVIPRAALAKCWIRQGRFDDAERLLTPTLAVVHAKGAPFNQDPFPLAHERRLLELLAQCDIGRKKKESALSRIAAASALTCQFEIVERSYCKAQTEALRGRDDEALRLLASTAEMGLNDVDQLEHDLAFTRLRGRPEFRAIVRAVRRREI